MARFRDIVLNEEEGTVEIGAGLTWTDVYSYLVPKGLNVVGGRVHGLGVGGVTLGGGRHSSQLDANALDLLNVVPVCQDILGRPISMVSQ
jgi:FAD/FMN-containing dehydrogenase